MVGGERPGGLGFAAEIDPRPRPEGPGRAELVLLHLEVLALDGQQVWAAEGTCAKSAPQDALAGLGAGLAGEIREAAGGKLPAFGGAW